MIVLRRPLGRKCSAARMNICSKSRYSNSLTAFVLLCLPLLRVLQHGGEWKDADNFESKNHPCSRCASEIHQS